MEHKSEAKATAITRTCLLNQKYVVILVEYWSQVEINPLEEADKNKLFMFRSDLRKILIMVGLKSDFDNTLRWAIQKRCRALEISIPAVAGETLIAEFQKRFNLTVER